MNLLAGKGDLDKDGYNVWFSFDAQKRDRLDQSGVDWLKDNDFRGLPGGKLVRTPTNYYNGNPTQRFPHAAGPAQDLDYGAVNPGKSGRIWAYNPAQYTTLMPGIERYHAALHGSYRLTPATELTPNSSTAPATAPRSSARRYPSPAACAPGTPPRNR